MAFYGVSAVQVVRSCEDPSPSNLQSRFFLPRTSSHDGADGRRRRGLEAGCPQECAGATRVRRHVIHREPEPFRSQSKSHNYNQLFYLMFFFAASSYPQFRR